MFYPRSLPSLFVPLLSPSCTRVLTIQCNEPMSNTRETRPLLFFCNMRFYMHARMHIQHKNENVASRNAHLRFRVRSFVESTSYRVNLLFTSSIGELPIALYTGIFVPLAVNARNHRARNNYSSCIGGNDRDKL